MIIHRSPFPDIDIPRQTIGACVFAGFEGREDEPVLIDGPTGRALTGRQLVEAVTRLAGGLEARGFGAGHVVAIMLPNLPEYAVVFHATAWAGGTVTTVNPSYTAEELRFQLQDAGAELLVTAPAFLATARAAVAGTAVREIAVLGEAEGATPLEALYGAPMAEPVPVDLDRHVLVMPYSSGTTGLPKGVMLSHANLVANVAQFRAVQPVVPGERTLAVLPFFHIYGMLVLMSYIPAGGGALVTLPRFELETALRLVEQHRMRRLFLVPPVVLALAKHPLVDGFDLGPLELIFSGAAPLGADLETACAARLDCAVVQGYGMTEMSPVSHATPHGGGRPGSAGAALPNTLCRIVDPETGADLPADAVGELWVQGPQVMLGYLNNPDATAATLQDGWLRTGDLGRIDADGYLSIVDRVKELIKVNGFQVPPAELEALLVSHPAVADAAVIGLPDAECGEIPIAFVVRAPGTDPSPAELQSFVAGHVAGYKQLRRLAFVETIPKSASGKILRRILRDDALASAEPAP
jgi:4-coumarate--CoA ligase